MSRFKAILFDLFGTVLHFAPHVPTVEAGGVRWKTTMGWLTDVVDAELPGVRFEEFLQVLMTVSGEIHRSRAPEYFEVPSPERFSRTLERLGVEASRAAEIAPRLSRVHMQHLAAHVCLPDGHVDLLQRLRANYRLALVSNFDSQPTAQSILEQHGVRSFFDPIVISDGFGRRKPHPAIFLRTIEQMGLANDDVVFVGDSASEDVAGAHQAGIAVVWINAEGAPYPAHLPAPTAELRTLLGLPAVLESL